MPHLPSTKMKRLFAMALLVGACAGAQPFALVAQTFPVTVHAEINPNPAAEMVTNYQFTWDGVAQAPVGVTVDVTCGCIKSAPISITNSAAHVVTATATNLWGTSVPATLTFQVKNPTATTNPSVKAGT